MIDLAQRLQMAFERDATLSQAGLARACKVSTASVSDWFSGKTKSLAARNLRPAAQYLRCSRDWLETGVGDPGWLYPQHSSQGVARHTVAHELSQTSVYAVSPATAVRVPVIGTLEMGSEGRHQLVAGEDGTPIGTVEAYSSSSDAFALRLVGDDLYPVARHGACLVVEPHGQCVEGELVLIELTDGHYMVRELVAQRPDSITVLPATGGMRATLLRSLVTAMHPVASVVAASKFRPRE